MRSLLVQLAGHILSCADRAAKRVALYTNTSQQEGGKRDCLDPSTPDYHSQSERDSDHHSQQEGDHDAHLFPQEGASSDDNTSQPGGAFQLDVYFSQKIWHLIMTFPINKREHPQTLL